MDSGILPREYHTIVNDIRNFVFGLAGATVYGSCKSRKQKFVMSFIINTCVLVVLDTSALHSDYSEMFEK